MRGAHRTKIESQQFAHMVYPTPDRQAGALGSSDGRTAPALFGDQQCGSVLVPLSVMDHRRKVARQLDHSPRRARSGGSLVRKATSLLPKDRRTGVRNGERPCTGHVRCAPTGRTTWGLVQRGSGAVLRGLLRQDKLDAMVRHGVPGPPQLRRNVRRPRRPPEPAPGVEHLDHRRNACQRA